MTSSRSGHDIHSGDVERIDDGHAGVLEVRDGYLLAKIREIDAALAVAAMRLSLTGIDEILSPSASRQCVGRTSAQGCDPAGGSVNRRHLQLPDADFTATTSRTSVVVASTGSYRPPPSCSCTV